MPFTRYAKRPYYKRRYCRKPPTKKAVATTKKIVKIAKKVHYNETEIKYTGTYSTQNMQPGNIIPTTGRPWFAFDPFVVQKGVSNNQRIGRMIQSSGVSVKFNCTNLYNFPIWLKIYAFYDRSPTTSQTAATQGLFLQDIDERKPIQPSGLAPVDLNYSHNTKSFRKVLERRFYFDPSSGGAGFQSRDERYTKQLKVWIPTKHKLYFDDEIEKTPPVETPNRRRMVIVWMISRPTGITDQQVTDQGEAFSLDYAVRHFYKDI